MTESARQALTILRDPSQFQWYVIPILLIVMYIYNEEVYRRNWNVFFGGLALWGADLFNEIWNSLVFHFTQYAPVWGAPGKTAYLMLIGLNIEITFMFLVMGIVACKSIPKDPKIKIFGIPNRVFYVAVFSVLSVIVECILNAAGVLTWEYSWWQPNFPFILFLIGYCPFFIMAFWVHDMKSVKSKAITVGSLLGFNLFCFILFGLILKWI